LRLSELTSGDFDLSDDPIITGVTSDSSEVQPGYLFAALPGIQYHGISFADAACKKGAAAILTSTDIDQQFDIPLLKSENPRADLAKIAALFFKDQPENIVMITGTNGKSSIAWLFRELAGNTAASIGTLGVQSNTHINDLPGYNLTSPEAVTLHKILKMFADNCITHAAIEATSIGLDRHRLDGVRIKAAAFTNFTQDHLDYHTSLDTYFEAKKRLFTELLPKNAPAILNKDIPEYEQLVTENTISYGTKDADIELLKATPHPTGQMLCIKCFDKAYEINFPYIGDFQAYNLMATLGLLHATGINIDDVIHKIPLVQAIPGRLERIDSSSIYIDYAHTPDALATVLQAMRPHTSGRLIVVFGCGGDRDKEKRPLMGKIAHDCADITIITDDNPRHENPTAIRQAIAVACPNANNIDDRKQAIIHGMSLMNSNDLLIIAGKGHETTQQIGDLQQPFHDATIVREHLKTLEKKHG
jgi:UDP-N-acetylmuramoyl-L-alanyl-D-glutamate--2,6-diaminopimelate ligase